MFLHLPLCSSSTKRKIDYQSCKLPFSLAYLFFIPFDTEAPGNALLRSSTSSSDFFIIPILYYHLIGLVLKINKSSQPYSCLILNYFIWKKLIDICVSHCDNPLRRKTSKKLVTFLRLSQHGRYKSYSFYSFIPVP